MNAINSFREYDNSTRINILVNCEYLKPKFNEEEMKAIDMHTLVEHHKRNPIFNYADDMCNGVYVDTGDVTGFVLLQKFIKEYNPVNICSIKCSPSLLLYLERYNYRLYSKMKMVHIFTRNT